MKFYLKILILIICGVTVVTAFSWKNCGNSLEPFKVMSLDVYSNQTKTLYLTGRGKVATNISAPIKENPKRSLQSGLLITIKHGGGSVQVSGERLSWCSTGLLAYITGRLSADDYLDFFNDELLIVTSILLLNTAIYQDDNTFIHRAKKGQVVMMKKFFWGWTKLPCVDNVGSCTYDDVCELSPFLHKKCPPNFIANGLPCKCPILQGQYAVKKFPIDMNILPHWIEEGQYRIQVTLHKDEEELLCLLMYIAF